MTKDSLHNKGTIFEGLTLGHSSFVLKDLPSMYGRSHVYTILQRNLYYNSIKNCVAICSIHLLYCKQLVFALYAYSYKLFFNKYVFAFHTISNVELRIFSSSVVRRNSKETKNIMMKKVQRVIING